MQNAIPPIYPPEPPLPTNRMAGFGKRWGAILIDVNVLVLFLVMIIYLFGSLMKGLIFDDLPFNFFGFGVMIILYFFGLPLLYILYCSLFECSRYQATPGKRAIGIKVTNLSGERISFFKAVGRNLAKILSGLIFYFGYFMAIWTPKKQALHDLMANTLVVMDE